VIIQRAIQLMIADGKVKLSESRTIAIALIPVICDTCISVLILQRDKEVAAVDRPSWYADNRMRAGCMQVEKSSLITGGSGQTRRAESQYRLLNVPACMLRHRPGPEH